MGIDYYGVLNLKRNTTQHDIKRAFRRMVLQFNPERRKDPSVHIVFSTITEAYDVLGDPFRRAIYDQYGEEGLKRGVSTPDGYVHPYVYHGDPQRTFREFFGADNPYPDLLDVLDKPHPIFTLPHGKGIKRKEPPVVHPLLLSLEEIYQGGMKKIKVQRLELIGSDATTTQMREKMFSIPFKAGVPNGTKLIFKEAGDQGPTIIPADIIFQITERPHDTFQRSGNDLTMFTTITLLDALIGVTVIVKTLDERTLRVNITDIISPQYQKILKGEGMPLISKPGEKGNLIIKFNIEFPKYLPASSKKMVVEAFQIASSGGGKEDQDYIHKKVMRDKMNRISRLEAKKLPL